MGARRQDADRVRRAACARADARRRLQPPAVSRWRVLAGERAEGRRRWRRVGSERSGWPRRHRAPHRRRSRHLVAPVTDLNHAYKLTVMRAPEIADIDTKELRGLGFMDQLGTVLTFQMPQRIQFKIEKHLQKIPN